MQISTNEVYHSKYDVLVICGGGSKVVVLLGMIQYLFELKCFERTNTYIGTSMGSIISLYMIVGLNPTQIMESIAKIDISNLQDGSILRSIAQNLPHRLGVFNTTNLANTISSVFQVHNIPSEMTLLDLYIRYKKELVVTAYNITKHTCEYISHKNYPEMRCIDAVVLSSCVPLYFIPVEYNGSMYIDGGVYDNFPIEYAVSSYSGKRILGLHINTKFDSTYENIIQYMYYLTNVLSKSVNKGYLDKYLSNPMVHIINAAHNKSSLPFNGLGDILYFSDSFIDGYNMIKTAKLKLD